MANPAQPSSSLGIHPVLNLMKESKTPSRIEHKWGPRESQTNLSVFSVGEESRGRIDENDMSDMKEADKSVRYKFIKWLRTLRVTVRQTHCSNTVFKESQLPWLVYMQTAGKLSFFLYYKVCKKRKQQYSLNYLPLNAIIEFTNHSLALGTCCNGILM